MVYAGRFCRPSARAEAAAATASTKPKAIEVMKVATVVGPEAAGAKATAAVARSTAAEAATSAT